MKVLQQTLFKIKLKSVNLLKVTKRNFKNLILFSHILPILGYLWTPTFSNMSCILKLLNKVKSYNKFYLISNEDKLK